MMQKVKILYGLEAAGGGALKHLVYLVTKLNKSYFDLTVIISDQRGEYIESDLMKMKKAGARIILMPMRRNIHILDLIILFQLYFHIKKNKYDIVHAHSSKAGALFRISAWLNSCKKIYYTPHCFYFQGKKGLKKTVFIFFEKLLTLITTSIIVSESEKNEALKNRISSKEKLVNINNAIDFDDYKQLEEVKETKEGLGIKVDNFVIGAIGRLTYQKDWETYIFAANEVLKQNFNIVFLIVGEGKLKASIEKLIKELNLEDKIILTGHIKEIYKIFGIIDVYVSTSLWEGLPYVFLEAMKYKKPIVATDTGNGSVIIDEETGFINPVKDYKAIAAKIMLLMNDKKLTSRMGDRGNQWLYQKYSFEYFIQQHETFYRQ